jgi:hypothetical protein
VLIDVAVRRTGVIESLECRSRDPVPHHEFLGKLLGALQPRAGASRAEDAKSSSAEGIHDPVGERRLGSHHGEDDVFRSGEFGELVHPRDRKVFEAGFAGGATVAGGDEDFLNTGAVRETPCDGVLPAPRTDDQKFHGRRKTLNA